MIPFGAHLQGQEDEGRGFQSMRESSGGLADTSRQDRIHCDQAYIKSNAQSSVLACSAHGHHVAMALPCPSSCQTLSKLIYTVFQSEMAQHTPLGSNEVTTPKSNSIQQQGVCAVVSPPQCTSWHDIWLRVTTHSGHYTGQNSAQSNKSMGYFLL